LAKTNCEIIFRIPLIEGVNTSEENIRQTANFINSLEGERSVVNLLPYHNIAENKHLKLGFSSHFEVFKTPTNDKIKEVVSLFKNYGIIATVGG
jgi:pyruvate formate lyase activating enzyme